MTLLVSVLLFLSLMIWSDWRDGKREGPRPTRVKAVYTVLVAAVLYHAVIATGRMNWLNFYDPANAIFGQTAKAFLRWFKAKG